MYAIDLFVIRHKTQGLVRLYGNYFILLVVLAICIYSSYDMEKKCKEYGPRKEEDRMKAIDVSPYYAPYQMLLDDEMEEEKEGSFLFSIRNKDNRFRLHFDDIEEEEGDLGDLADDHRCTEEGCGIHMSNPLSSPSSHHPQHEPRK